jgi:translocation protein SEC66
MEPEEGSEKAPKVPESVIRAALLRRAVEDIHRIIQIRTAKQACSSLLQRGSVGDDLWQRFQRAEKEMEEELRDVVMEVGCPARPGRNFSSYLFISWLTQRQQANALVPGWGQIIFQSANEIAANKALRDRLEEIEEQTERDKEWWEKRRSSIKTEFMKELDQEASEEKVQTSKASVAGSEDEPVLVDTDTPSATPSGASKKKKGKK